MASFFKALEGCDFTRQLRLPRALLREYEPGVRRNVQLRHSGKTWDVKLEQVEASLCFTRGWEKFATDVGLRQGEFVVFMFNSDFIIDVLVYGKDTCERKSLAAFVGVDEDEDSDEEALVDVDEDDDSDESSPLYFKIRSKPHHRSRVCVPAKFRSATGMKEKESVSLEYGNKKAVIKLEHRENMHIIELARGWPEFWKACGMVVGKTYSFTFKPSRNVIQVKEVKKGK